MKVDAGGVSCLLLSLLTLGACAPEPDPLQYAGGRLRLAAVLGETDLTGYAVADRIRRFDFPADHGAHPDFRSEWWYLTLTLEDDSGAPVGVQFTLFRQALSAAGDRADNRWQSNDVYLAHFALTDVRSGEHRVSERFARGHPRLAGVIADPFQLWLEDWRIVSSGDQWQLSAGSSEQGVDLTLEMNRTPVLQGQDGLSRKGADQASYYYSIPGIEVSGSVRLDGTSRAVQGRGWLDREWSTSVLSGGQLGWDWFALQLADERKVMVFQLRRQDGSRDPFDQGLLVEADGTTSALAVDDFSLRPVRYWKDDAGIAWPVGWRVQLGAEVWRVVAVLDDQLMDTTIRYWEGLVDVYDAAGVLIGRGYLELTGYDRSAD